MTPLIYEFDGTSYSIIGIGATVTVTTSGAQTYAFDLVSGTNVVDTNTYFGYRDGTTTSTNEGTISFDGSSSGALMDYFFIGSAISAGENLGSPNAQLNRNYSLQATETAAPEPSEWLLLACGLGALIGRKHAWASR